MGAFGTLLIFAAVAGLIGLAGAVAILFGIVYATRRGYYALKGEPYRPLLGAGSQPEYEHQDVEAGADASSVRAVLKRYMSTAGVGKHARAGLSALDGAERKAASFRAVLDSKFQPSSMTWSKFSTAATSAQGAVLRNCAALANDIQLFDHADYRQLEQARRRATFRSDAQLDATQLEKYGLFQAKLAEMEAICDANEKMLLELDKLAAELDKLDDIGASAESERLIAEVRALTEETRYYKQRLDDMG